MMKQHILHKMILDEIMEFKKINLNPTTLVIRADVLHHMLGWEDIRRYYIPKHETKNKKAMYLNLEVVESVPYDDLEYFVCCAAFAGKSRKEILTNV